MGEAIYVQDNERKTVKVRRVYLEWEEAGEVGRASLGKALWGMGRI